MQLVMKKEVWCLLFTWRDIFVDDPEIMPITNLVIHTIPFMIPPAPPDQKIGYTHSKNPVAKGEHPKTS